MNCLSAHLNLAQPQIYRKPLSKLITRLRRNFFIVSPRNPSRYDRRRIDPRACAPVNRSVNLSRLNEPRVTGIDTIVACATFAEGYDTPVMAPMRRALSVIVESGLHVSLIERSNGASTCPAGAILRCTYALIHLGLHKARVRHSSVESSSILYRGILGRLLFTWRSLGWSGS